MKTKAAVAAFTFVALVFIGMVTNLVIVPPELMAWFILLSCGAAMILCGFEGPNKEAGSGWLLGLVLTFGLMSLIVGIGSVIEQVVGK